MNREPSSEQLPDYASYSVGDFLLEGTKFVGGYTPADAIDDYMEEHPEADRAAVEAELKAYIARHG